MRSSSLSERPARSGRRSAAVKALGLGPRDWLDLLVASAELAIARIRIAMSDRAALLRPAAAIAHASEADKRIERVRLAVARASYRLPWRTDCVVQAIAAQHWLRRLGVETSLCIGVSDKKRDPFEAHAWLMHGDEVITGGDIEDYIPLVDSAPGLERGRSRKN